MDDFSDIEQELRKLNPAPPSAALQARLERELEPNSRQINGQKRLGALPLHWVAPLAVAAVLTLAAYLNFSQSPPAAVPAPPTFALNNGKPTATAVVVDNEASRFVPVTARQMLIGAQEEGIYFDEEDMPTRRMRYQFVDSYLWENPADGSSLQVNMPREEVLLVRLNTY